MSIKVVPVQLNLTDSRAVEGHPPTEFRKKEADIAADFEEQLNAACPPGGVLVGFISSSETRKEKFLAVFNVSDDVSRERSL